MRHKETSKCSRWCAFTQGAHTNTDTHTQTQTHTLTSCSSKCAAHQSLIWSVCPPAHPRSQTCTWWRGAERCLCVLCWRWSQTGRPQTSGAFPEHEEQRCISWFAKTVWVEGHSFMNHSLRNGPNSHQSWMGYSLSRAPPLHTSLWKSVECFLYNPDNNHTKKHTLFGRR